MESAVLFCGLIETQCRFHTGGISLRTWEVLPSSLRRGGMEVIYILEKTYQQKCRRTEEHLFVEIYDSAGLRSDFMGNR